VGWHVDVAGGIAVAVDYGWGALCGTKLTSCAFTKALADFCFNLGL
jgi:hypothetical protein